MTFWHKIDDSTDCCGSISPKIVLIFPKNFLNIRFDAIEKQSSVNLSRHGSKSYTSVAPGDSKIGFYREGEDTTY